MPKTSITKVFKILNRLPELKIVSIESWEKNFTLELENPESLDAEIPDTLAFFGFNADLERSGNVVFLDIEKREKR